MATQSANPYSTYAITHLDHFQSHSSFPAFRERRSSSSSTTLPISRLPESSNSHGLRHHAESPSHILDYARTPTRTPRAALQLIKGRRIVASQPDEQSSGEIRHPGHHEHRIRDDAPTIKRNSPTLANNPTPQRSYKRSLPTSTPPHPIAERIDVVACPNSPTSRPT